MNTKINKIELSEGLTENQINIRYIKNVVLWLDNELYLVIPPSCLHWNGLKFGEPFHTKD